MSRVWGKTVNHNDEAEWLRELEEEMNGVEKQVNVAIDVDSVTIQLRTTPNLEDPWTRWFIRVLAKNLEAVLLFCTLVRK